MVAYLRRHQNQRRMGPLRYETDTSPYRIASLSSDSQLETFFIIAPWLLQKRLPHF